MRLFGSIHRICATLVVALVAVWLGKFDRIGFYHQYFRAIVEVELRNSQALPVHDLADQVWSSQKVHIPQAQSGMAADYTLPLLAESDVLATVAPDIRVSMPNCPTTYQSRAP